ISGSAICRWRGMSHRPYAASDASKKPTRIKEHCRSQPQVQRLSTRKPRGMRMTAIPSRTPPTSSSSSSSAPPVSLAAAKGAQQLFRLCRKRKDVASPREFVFAVAYVLNRYSDDIIREVTDPATGLPGTLKFPLEIADVKRACEAQEQL